MVTRIPKGVPADIDMSQYHSINELFDKSCDRFASSPAYTNMGVTITYQQLNDLSKAFASMLQNELHLTKGDRLAIMMPNLLQYPIALFGAMRAGITNTNVNPLYTQSLSINFVIPRLLLLLFRKFCPCVRKMHCQNTS